MTLLEMMLETENQLKELENQKVNEVDVDDIIINKTHNRGNRKPISRDIRRTLRQTERCKMLAIKANKGKLNKGNEIFLRENKRKMSKVNAEMRLYMA